MSSTPEEVRCIGSILGEKQIKFPFSVFPINALSCMIRDAVVMRVSRRWVKVAG